MKIRRAYHSFISYNFHANWLSLDTFIRLKSKLKFFLTFLWQKKCIEKSFDDNQNLHHGQLPPRETFFQKVDRSDQGASRYSALNGNNEEGDHTFKRWEAKKSLRSFKFHCESS